MCIWFSASADFEALQSYDVADLIKQYFRELPECLLTNKFSETFINVFLRRFKNTSITFNFKMLTR